MKDFKRKPRVGLLLLASARFEKLGEETKEGTYGERKKKEAEQIISALSETVDVIFGGICYTPENAESAIHTFKNEKVDLITASFMSWSEDEAWIHALRAIGDIPLLYASIVREKIPYENTQDESDFVNFLSCGSLVGFLVGSGSLARFAPTNEVFFGTLEGLCQKVSVLARAAKARAILNGSTVTMLSHYNDAMWATYVDPYNLFKVFGAKLSFLSISELVREIEKTDEQEVASLLKDFRARYRVMEDVDEEKFAASLKASLAMENLALSIKTDLLVLNDIEKPLFQEVGLRPGFSPVQKDSPLTAVPEGDLGAGLAVYILKLITGRPANFIEPFYLDQKRGVFAAGHAGPNDYTECQENLLIGRDTRFAKTSYRYAGAPFAWYVYPQGLKTMLHLSECNGRIKMAFSTVECLETKHYLASYSHADFRHTHLSNEEYMARLAAFGVTQHFAIVSGDCTSELEAFAKMYGFEYLKI